MKKIDCSPYPITLHFTTDVDAFYRKRKALTGRTDRDEHIAGMCSYNRGHDQMVVGLFPADSSVLVHELSHAAIHIFHAVGMKVNQHTTEAFAYLLESLHRQCNAYLNEQANVR